jgi:hypothetical protein
MQASRKLFPSTDRIQNFNHSNPKTDHELCGHGTHAEARLITFLTKNVQRVNYLGVYHRIVLTLASVLCTSGYVIICAHLTIINVDSAAAF